VRPDWLYQRSGIPIHHHPGLTRQPGTSQKQNRTVTNENASSFEGILRNKLSTGSNPEHSQTVKTSGTLQFSRHAQERLRLRDIQLSTEQLLRIQKGVDEVAQKGGKDSLVICGDITLVVNIPNRTVITALDQNQSTHHVFTQIDSAVIV
jgi:flagellar operon protein